MVAVFFDGDGMIQFVNESLLLTEVCLNVSHTDLQREIVVTVATEEGTALGNVLPDSSVSVYYAIFQNRPTLYQYLAKM